MRFFCLLFLALLGCREDSKDSVSETGSVDLVDADGDGFDSIFDCDDANDAVHPDAEETCDGIDNNCDGIPGTDADGDLSKIWGVTPGV